MGLTPAALDRQAHLSTRCATSPPSIMPPSAQVALAWLVGYYGDTVIPIAGADRNRSPASASSEAAKPTG
jgi:hypothetical protein